MDCAGNFVVNVGKTTPPRGKDFGFLDMAFLSGLGS